MFNCAGKALGNAIRDLLPHAKGFDAEQLLATNRSRPLLFSSLLMFCFLQPHQSNVLGFESLCYLIYTISSILGV